MVLYNYISVCHIFNNMNNFKIVNLEEFHQVNVLFLKVEEIQEIQDLIFEKVKGNLRASLVAQLVKNPPAMWETWVRSLGWEDSLEAGMAAHASILAWRVPTEVGARQTTVHRVTESWMGLRTDRWKQHLGTLVFSPVNLSCL